MANFQNFGAEYGIDLGHGNILEIGTCLLKCEIFSTKIFSIQMDTFNPHGFGDVSGK